MGFAGVGSTGRRLRFHASRCELSDGRSIGWRGGSFHDLTVDAAPKTVFDASRGSMIGAIFGVDDALCGTLRKCCGWSGLNRFAMSETDFGRPRVCVLGVANFGMYLRRAVGGRRRRAGAASAREAARRGAASGSCARTV